MVSFYSSLDIHMMITAKTTTTIAPYITVSLIMPKTRKKMARIAPVNAAEPNAALTPNLASAGMNITK